MAPSDMQLLELTTGMDGALADSVAEDWIDARVAKALEAAPVETASATLLKEMLRTRMAGRQLPAGELVRMAKELLASLDKVAPNADR